MKIIFKLKLYIKVSLLQLSLSLNIFKELSYEPVNKYPLSLNYIIFDMISLCALKLRVSFNLSFNILYISIKPLINPHAIKV